MELNESGPAQILIYLPVKDMLHPGSMNRYGTDDSFVGESSRLDWKLLLGANVLYFHRSEQQFSKLTCGQMVQNLFSSVN